jgi:hypothetical protein
MAHHFRAPERRQQALLPANMMEWLPENDIVHLIVEAVGIMDLSKFEASNKLGRAGQAPFVPQVGSSPSGMACHDRPCLAHRGYPPHGVSWFGCQGPFLRPGLTIPRASARSRGQGWPQVSLSAQSEGDSPVI